MRAVTAKVINSGGFQAIRLPKDFRVESSTVRLSKTASGFVVSEVKSSARHLKAFKALLPHRGGRARTGPPRRGVTRGYGTSGRRRADGCSRSWRIVFVAETAGPGASGLAPVFGLRSNRGKLLLAM